MNKQACSGNERLNKKAFLSMIGANKFIKPKFNNSLKNKQIEEIKRLLQENNGDKKVTASMLGITVSSLNRKLNYSDVEVINDDEVGSPNLSRRYFENLKIDWKISSFDSQTKQVCIELNPEKCSKKCFNPVYLSVVVPVPK